MDTHGSLVPHLQMGTVREDAQADGIGIVRDLEASLACHRLVESILALHTDDVRSAFRQCQRLAGLPARRICLEFVALDFDFRRLLLSGVTEPRDLLQQRRWLRTRLAQHGERQLTSDRLAICSDCLHQDIGRFTRQHRLGLGKYLNAVSQRGEEHLSTYGYAFAFDHRIETQQRTRLVVSRVEFDGDLACCIGRLGYATTVWKVYSDGAVYQWLSVVIGRHESGFHRLATEIHRMSEIRLEAQLLKLEALYLEHTGECGSLLVHIAHQHTILAHGRFGVEVELRVQSPELREREIFLMNRTSLRVHHTELVGRIL